MYINYLPTIEDLREYQFASPVKSTAEQQKAAGEFIDSLDLCAGGEEQLKPKMTFNPVLQYMYQCIQHRALNPEDPKLPALDENIAAYIKPDKTLFEKAEAAVGQFAKSFELKKIDKEESKRKRVYWRDLISKEEKKEGTKADMTAAETETMQQEAAAEKSKGVFEPEEIKEISVVDPINDFKKMIGERHRDRVAEAVGQMKTIIRRFVDESLMGSTYDRALECLAALRDSCVKEDEPTEYNDFLTEIKEKYSKGKHKQFWDMVVAKKVTLITKEESINSLIELAEAESVPKCG
ncbi:MAG: Ku70/Ku80 C-terminal arm domain-containing protein [Candidatus Pacebacteria bacterium]|nr:Ku70/Ku80 C-terminal arm domain-containing protein [Candidatus Paceibacterota bacterium]